MRKQYHFRPSAQGLLAWDVDRLIVLSSGFEPKEILLSSIKELDENYWFAYEGQVPTVRAVTEHLALIAAVDPNYPIILSSDGLVMDGMHRAAKALLDNQPAISAVQFTEDPLPDFIGIAPGDLPYER